MAQELDPTTKRWIALALYDYTMFLQKEGYVDRDKTYDPLREYLQTNTVEAPSEQFFQDIAIHSPQIVAKMQAEDQEGWDNKNLKRCYFDYDEEDDDDDDDDAQQEEPICKYPDPLSADYEEQEQEQEQPEKKRRRSDRIAALLEQQQFDDDDDIF